MQNLKDLQDLRNNYFEKRRQDVGNQVNRQLQESDDAINRRFASLGASGSGAAIANLQKNREAAAQMKNQQIDNIQAQELQAGEGDFARQFQAEEAGRQRDFQGGLARNDLEFKRNAFNTENTNKLTELDLARQQFELDKDTTAFNKQLALMQAGGGGGQASEIFGMPVNPEDKKKLEFFGLTGINPIQQGIGQQIGRGIGGDIGKAVSIISGGGK